MNDKVDILPLSVAVKRDGGDVYGDCADGALAHPHINFLAGPEDGTALAVFVPVKPTPVRGKLLSINGGDPHELGAIKCSRAMLAADGPWANLPEERTWPHKKYPGARFHHSASAVVAMDLAAIGKPPEEVRQPPAEDPPADPVPEDPPAEPEPPVQPGTAPDVTASIDVEGLDYASHGARLVCGDTGHEVLTHLVLIRQPDGVPNQVRAFGNETLSAAVLDFGDFRVKLNRVRRFGRYVGIIGDEDFDSLV